MESHFWLTSIGPFKYLAHFYQKSWGVLVWFYPYWAQNEKVKGLFHHCKGWYYVDFLPSLFLWYTSIFMNPNTEKWVWVLDHKTVNERDEIYGCAEFLAALLIPLQHLCNGGKSGICPSDIQHQILNIILTSVKFWT